MKRAVRKAINRTLSAALRAEGIPRNGAHWAEAVSVRDTLMHEAGYGITQACRMAATHVRMWGTAEEPNDAPVLTDAERIFAPTYAPVTQAPSHEDLEEIDAEVEARIARAFA